MAAVTLTDIRKSFGNTAILRGISLDIPDGECTVLLGPSGCGKSTLLRAIAGLDAIDSGTIAIGGRDVAGLPPVERGIAMVFQSYALYPHMTVAENIGFGLALAKRPRVEIEARVAEAARVLQLDGLLSRRPKDLSGGQRQRVAIGRAMVRQPEVFLLDEPLSNLDASLRVGMRVEFARLREQLRNTMIYVTHDQVEAMTLGDRIVVLRGGVVEQVGAPLEVYRRPRNLFVAQFIGSPKMNVFDVHVTDVSGSETTVAATADGEAVRVPIRSAALAAGTPVRLGVRPEHLLVSGASSPGLPGVVTMVEQLGSDTYLHLALDGYGAAIARAPGFSAHGRGAAIRVTASSDAWHLFDGAGLAVAA